MEKWFVALLLCFSISLHSEDITGFWKTMDEQTGKPTSLVGIYQHEGKYYGRILGTYNDQGQIETKPKSKAPGVEGNPPFIGLDIIWDLKPEGKRFDDGKIIDPRNGKVYDAQAWVDDGKLIVRGQILMMGENREWLPVQKEELPNNIGNLNELKPKIPTPQRTS